MGQTWFYGELELNIVKVLLTRTELIIIQMNLNQTKLLQFFMFEIN